MPLASKGCVDHGRPCSTPHRQGSRRDRCDHNPVQRVLQFGWPDQRSIQGRGSTYVMPPSDHSVFVYMYRDAANYKVGGALLLEGVYNEAIEKALHECCDSWDHFVVEQVGVPRSTPSCISSATARPSTTLPSTSSSTCALPRRKTFHRYHGGGRWTSCSHGSVVCATGTARCRHTAGDAVLHKLQAPPV